MPARPQGTKWVEFPSHLQRTAQGIKDWVLGQLPNIVEPLPKAADLEKLLQRCRGGGRGRWAE